MRNLIRVVALLVAFSSCSREELDREGYIKFMSDDKNGYLKYHKIGKNEYWVQLATPEFIACKQFDQPGLDIENFTSRIKELDSTICFVIKLKTIDNDGTQSVRPQTITDANTSVAYYGQHAMEDIFLEVGDQRLHPIAYEYENNYGLAPYNSIVVVFKFMRDAKSLELIFNDRYRGVYALSSNYSLRLITHAPKLKIN